MKLTLEKIHIGRRTIKTVAAVVIAMLVVDYFGATSSKLIFAMMGAMEAVRPTFKESLEAVFSQFVGIFVGALAAVLLHTLPIPAVLYCCNGLYYGRRSSYDLCGGQNLGQCYWSGRWCIH